MTAHPGDWEVTDFSGKARSVATSVFDQAHEHIGADRYGRACVIRAPTGCTGRGCRNPRRTGRHSRRRLYRRRRRRRTLAGTRCATSAPRTSHLLEPVAETSSGRRTPRCMVLRSSHRPSRQTQYCREKCKPLQGKAIRNRPLKPA